ncbi:MAG: hypothetical protein ACHQNV_07145, partial [Vicinamibacteria bacterium]
MDEPLDRERWRQAAAVLDAVLDLPVAERTRYVEEACGGDGELQRLVEELLDAEAADDAFLAAPAAEHAAPLIAEM